MIEEEYPAVVYLDGVSLTCLQVIGQNAPGKSTTQPEIFFLSPKNGPEELSEPSFDIAGGGDELILEIHLCESFVAGAP
jgi:hypothetical protein